MPIDPTTQDASESPTALVWLSVRSMALNLSRVNCDLTAIAERAGLDLDTTEDALEDLAQIGMLSVWDAGDGPVATLTPRTAAELGLKLRYLEGRGGMEWMPVGKRDPMERRRPRVIATASALGIDLDRLAGNAPRPDQEAEAGEMMESLVPKQSRRLSDAVRSGAKLPFPKLVITGSSAWSRPDGGPCPVCAGENIGFMTYCAYCDRFSAIEWIVAKIQLADARDAAAIPKTSIKPFARRRAGGAD